MCSCFLTINKLVIEESLHYVIVMAYKPYSCDTFKYHYKVIPHHYLNIFSRRTFPFAFLSKCPFLRNGSSEVYCCFLRFLRHFLAPVDMTLFLQWFTPVEIKLKVASFTVCHITSYINVDSASRVNTVFLLFAKNGSTLNW